jgi:hypothetical protein
MHRQNKLRVGFAGTSDPKRRGREVSPDLARGLEILGYEIADDNNLQVLININHNWRSICEVEESETAGNCLKILIRVEPASVYPNQYTSAIESQYDLILNPGRINRAKEEFLRWPYAYQINPSAPSGASGSLKSILESNVKEGIYSYDNWIIRPIAFSMIAANKISPNGTGNYALRRKFANYDFSGIFQVYGSLWHSSFWTKLRYRLGVLKFALQSQSEYRIRDIFGGLTVTYRNAVGSVIDKHSVIKSSKFSVVVENSNDYVSEKLLDALVGGSIPIYFGPDLTKTGIPEDLIIRSDREVPDFLEILNSLDRDEIELKLERILMFLGGREFALWHADKVHKEICVRIDLMIKSASE